MPFAGYKDFDDCVAKNRDKDDPEAYCGSIQSKAEGRSFRKAKRKRGWGRRFYRAGFAAVDKVPRDADGKWTRKGGSSAAKPDTPDLDARLERAAFSPGGQGTVTVDGRDVTYRAGDDPQDGFIKFYDSASGSSLGEALLDGDRWQVDKTGVDGHSFFPKLDAGLRYLIA